MLVDRMPLVSLLRHDLRTALKRFYGAKYLDRILRVSAVSTLAVRRLAVQRRHGLTLTVPIMRCSDNI
jgi:hypothetical protein